MRMPILRSLLVCGLLLACGDDASPVIDGAPAADSPPGAIDGPPGPDSPPGTPDAGGGNACTGVTPVAGTPALQLQQVATGLDLPVLAAAPPGDPRLFIVEKDVGGGQGRIRIVKAGALLATPFLTISGLATGSEQGLLGLAFHPDYATNGRFFVNYTDNTGGDTHVAEYSVSADPDVANPTGQDVIVIDQPFSNHNGGMIAFGPDDMLYIGMGDGGSGGDPQGHGQNVDSLLGKMLRIDVTTLPYTVPASNPFVGVNGADEIWSSGLRNPWRFSFDRQTGDMYIGDVGQGAYEEIDFEPAGTAGRNYGWAVVEGDGHCFGGGVCDQTGMTNPVHEYTHGGGNCSVTGGYVYRGCLMPGHHGKYFYADYCVSDVKSFEIVGGATSNPQDWAGLSGGNISSFGEDHQGELYVVDLGGTTGTVSKVVPAP